MFEQIKATILSPDGQTESSRRFTEDELTGLLQAIPTGDERKALSTYHGDVRNLGDVEQFMLEMMTVPQVILSQGNERFRRVTPSFVQALPDSGLKTMYRSSLPWHLNYAPTC
jgi:hypothetical protein